MRNKMSEAKALSRDLVEVCRRSNAGAEAVIEALSVVLGMVIVHTADSEAMAREVTAFALQTIHKAIASQAESKGGERGSDFN
jgi:hypothetical protein